MRTLKLHWLAAGFELGSALSAGSLSLALIASAPPAHHTFSTSCQMELEKLKAEAKASNDQIRIAESERDEAQLSLAGKTTTLAG